MAIAIGGSVAHNRTTVEPQLWPGSTNTGVPAGTTLTSVAAFDTTANNQVIDALHISGGPLNIRHSGVVITRCLFTSPGLSSWNIDIGPGGEAASCTITDCELDAGTSDQGGIRNQSLSNSSWTGLRLNIHNGENGVRVGGNATLRDSYIHNFVSHQGTSGHFDGVECYEGSNNLIDHCWIDLDQPETCCINVQGDFGAIGTFTVQKCYLNGGGPLFNIRSGGAAGSVAQANILNNSLGVPGAHYGDGSLQYSAIDVGISRTTTGNVLYSNGSNADGLI